MTKIERLKKLANKNRKANKEQAKEVIETISVLRKQGLRTHEYSLKNPFRVRSGLPPFLRMSGGIKLKQGA